MLKILVKVILVSVMLLSTVSANSQMFGMMTEDQYIEMARKSFEAQGATLTSEQEAVLRESYGKRMGIHHIARKCELGVSCESTL